MNTKILDEKYAMLLLKKCLSFNHTNSLFINIDTKENLDFANLIEKKAHEMGITDIKINVADREEIHDYLKSTKLEDISIIPLIDGSTRDDYAKKGASILFIDSLIPNLMNDIEPEKISKMNSLVVSTLPNYKAGVSKYLFPWCIAAYPNKRWADMLFPNNPSAYKNLYFKIMEMCMVDKEDPVQAWDNYITQSNRYKDILNSLEISSMHYKNSLGTDLELFLPEGTIWQNLDKKYAKGSPVIVNMPSYEIFASPDYRKTNGIVYASKPLVYAGKIIDNFMLKFKDGKVIDYKAMVGEDVLQKIIETDDHSAFLGEVALVNHNSPISKTNFVYYETLFDENAACHLALGRSFPRTIPNGSDLSDEELLTKGLNVSMVHQDFMVGTSDLEIEATTNRGKILIFKNGNFNI